MHLYFNYNIFLPCPSLSSRHKQICSPVSYANNQYCIYNTVYCLGIKSLHILKRNIAAPTAIHHIFLSIHELSSFFSEALLWFLPSSVFFLLFDSSESLNESEILELTDTCGLTFKADNSPFPFLAFVQETTAVIIRKITNVRVNVAIITIL